MDEQYTSLIYKGMLAAYGKKGFSLSEEEFVAKINNNDEYQTLIYKGMEAFYGSKGFSKPLEDFKLSFNSQDPTQQPQPRDANIVPQEQPAQQEDIAIEGTSRDITPMERLTDAVGATGDFISGGAEVVGGKIVGDFTKSLFKWASYDIPVATLATVAGGLSGVRKNIEYAGKSNRAIEKSIRYDKELNERAKQGLNEVTTRLNRLVEGVSKGVLKQEDYAGEFKNLKKRYEFLKGSKFLEKGEQGVLVEVQRGVMKDAYEWQEKGIEFSDDLISSLDKIESPMDAILWASQAAGQAVGQIPLAAATFGASGFVQEFGEIYMQGVKEIAAEKGITPIEVIEGGYDDPATAATYSFVAAGLEYIGAENTMVGVGKKALGKELAKRAKIILKTSSGEALTEAAQTILEQIGTQTSGKKGVLDVNIDWKDVIESAAQGAVGSGGITTLSQTKNAVETNNTRKVVKDIESVVSSINDVLSDNTIDTSDANKQLLNQAEVAQNDNIETLAEENNTDLSQVDDAQFDGIVKNIEDATRRDKAETKALEDAKGITKEKAPVADKNKQSTKKKTESKVTQTKKTDEKATNEKKTDTTKKTKQKKNDRAKKKVEDKKDVKVEKTKKEETKTKTKVQESATVSSEKPVVQKEKVPTEPAVIEKKQSKAQQEEAAQREKDAAESLKRTEKEAAKQKIIDDKKAAEDKIKEDKHFKEIDYQNRSSAIVERTESKAKKIVALEKLAEKARKEGITTESIDKKKAAMQESLDADILDKKNRVEKAEKKKAKIAAEENKKLPTHKDGEYMGVNEKGSPIFKTKDNKRFIVEEGKKKTQTTTRSKYTKDELKVRANMVDGHNAKIGAFEKAMTGIFTRITGYSKIVNETKDQATKAKYQEAVKKAEQEAKELKAALKEWQDNPMKGQEGLEGLIDFKKTKKTEKAIKAAKEAAKTLPTPQLNKRLKGKQKETLSEKDRKPLLGGEKVRQEKVTKEVGTLISKLNDRDKLNIAEKNEIEDIRKRASESQQRKIDKAVERVNEREKEAAAIAFEESLDNAVLGEEDFILNEDGDFRVSNMGLPSKISEKNYGEGVIKFRGKSEKIASATELFTSLKKKYGDNLNGLSKELNKVFEDLTTELLDNINKARKDAGLSPVNIYLTENIIQDGVENAAHGIALTDNKNKTGIAALVIATNKDAVTPLHEAIHIWHQLLSASQELSAIETQGFDKITAKYEKVSEIFNGELEDLRIKTIQLINQKLRLFHAAELENGSELDKKLANFLQSEVGLKVRDSIGYNFKEGRVDANSAMLTNSAEFLAYGISEGGFVEFLNLLDTGSKTIKNRRITIFDRIAKLALDVFNIFGSKVNQESTLRKLIDITNYAASEGIKEGSKFTFNETNRKVNSLMARAAKVSRRFKAIEEAILSNVKTEEDVQGVADKLNKKLPKGFKITKQEVKRLYNKVKKGGAKKLIDTEIDSMVKLTNPKRFQSKGSTPKNVKGIRADADTIKLLTQINERLTKNQDKEALAQAEERLESFTNRIFNGEELTEAEQLSFDLTRFEVSRNRTLDEVKTLKHEINNILKDGAIARRNKRLKKQADRKLLREIGLGKLGIKGSEVTEKEYKEALKKNTPAKQKTLWDKQLTRLKNAWTNWGINNESFHSMLDLIGGNEKGATPMNTWFNRRFGVQERAANIKKHTLQNTWNDSVIDKISEIFFSETTKTNKKNLTSVIKEMADENIELSHFDENNGEEVTESYSLDQIANVWMWMQQEGTEKNMLAHGYGADFRNQIDAKMDANPKMKQMAEWFMNDFYVDIYNDINKAYRERMGHDLPKSEFYSPLVYDYKGEVKDDNTLLQQYHPVASTLRSFTFKRQQNTQKLDFTTSMFGNATRHIDNAAHFVSYDAFVSDLRSFFRNPQIMKALEMKFGNRMNDVMNMYIEVFAKENALKSQTHTVIDKIRANMVTTFLGANPTIYMKQLTSSIAYSTAMPDGSASWKSMQTAALVPGSEMAKEKAKYISMIKSHPLFKDRVKMGQRTIGEAHKSLMNNRMFGELVDKGVATKMQQWMMGLVKAGDMGAITQGGWANLKAEVDLRTKAGMSQKAAVDAGMQAFIHNTLIAQQSTATADLSAVQLDNNAFVRLFISFTTTPMQYLRNSRAARRAIARNKLGSKAQMKAGVQLAMYSTILPVFFQLVSQAFQVMFTDDDDERDKLLGRIAYSPIQSMLSANHVIGGVIDSAIRKIVMGEDFGNYGGLVGSMSGIVTSGLESMVKLMGGGSISEKEGIKVLDMIGILSGGLPAGNVAEMVMGLNSALAGDGDWRNAMGWSDYSLAKSRSGGKSKTTNTNNVSPRRRLINRRLQRRR